MLILTLVLPFIIFYIEKNKKILKFLPALGVIIAILLWGLYGYNKTGRFPFGGSVITSNSEALHNVVLNKKFLDYYPYKSVDLIPNDKRIPKTLTNEWEVFDYYDKKNQEYLKRNFHLYLKGIFVKIKFILFNIYKDSTFPDENNNFNNKFMPSYLFNKVIFNLAIFIFVLKLYEITKSRKIQNKTNYYKIDFYFIVIMVLSLMPHIIAWATAKHLVAAQQICLIFLFLKFFKKLDKGVKIEKE